jgi:dihydroflavonol-4-reductase
MERGQPGRRHLLCGTNLTLVDLLGELSRLTGIPVPRWEVPYAVGLAVAVLSEAWADFVSSRIPKATVTGVRLTRRSMQFDPAETRKILGLEPRPVEKSLADCVRWLIAAGEVNLGKSRPGLDLGEIESTLAARKPFPEIQEEGVEFSL